MEDQLRSLVAQDEKLLWVGHPEPFDTMDKTNKNSLIFGIILKLAAIAGCLTLYINPALASNGIRHIPVIAILAFGAYALANPFLVAARLRSRTLYGLTDKRILRAGTNEGSVPYADIRSAVLRTDADGHTSLLCGDRTKKLKPRQWRLEADAAFINKPDGPEDQRVVLYAIPADKELKALLNKYLHVQ